MLTQPDRPGNGRSKPHDGPSPKHRERQPGWVQGLRQIYNSVLDEPLPPSFDSLLKKLDEKDGDRG
jgi:hypothetical protein